MECDVFTSNLRSLCPASLMGRGSRWLWQFVTGPTCRTTADGKGQRVTQLWDTFNPTSMNYASVIRQVLSIAGV